MSHHLEEPLPAVMVGFVGLEVALEVIDALSEEGDLDGGAAAIALVPSVLLDDALAFLLRDARHVLVSGAPFRVVGAPPLLGSLIV